MKRNSTIKINGVSQSIIIDGPVVIISAEEYDLLCKEAGYTPTPKLDKRIAQARINYRKKKTLSRAG